MSQPLDVAGLLAVGLLVLFNLVTLHLVQLQKENDELRTRLEALEGREPATDLPENGAVAHGRGWL